MSQTVTFIFVGTGCSSTIPRLSCLIAEEKKCETCFRAIQPGNKNRRRNVSGLVKYNDLSGIERVIAIDVGKIWWEGALEIFPENEIRKLDAILLTHEHFDAIGGLDNLRDLTSSTNSRLDIHLNSTTDSAIHQIFPYFFLEASQIVGGGIPLFNFHVFENGSSFVVNDLLVTPFTVEHGPNCRNCSAFRIGELAYISDVSRIPDESRQFLKGAKYIVLDMLKDGQEDKSRSSHFTFDDAIEEIENNFNIGLIPDRIFFVGLCHSVEHESINSKLEQRGLFPRVECAFDGMTFNFNIEFYIN